MKRLPRVLGSLAFAVMLYMAIWQCHLLDETDAEIDLLRLGIKAIFNLVLAGIVLNALRKAE